ncbi:MAG: hypothetical protein K0Q55_1350 [Verrucomicrobia bacterium]|jgi:hypothetical protein|nr:hypothetical protein [Verrucomicrobiota bacterium]
MKNTSRLLLIALALSFGTQTAVLAADKKPTETYKFKATDGRKIEIGKSKAADGGKEFKNPHMEKCWLADGFTFSGYDTLYIAPTASTAKYNPDGEKIHEYSKMTLPVEFARMIKQHNIFAHVVTSQSEIKPGAKVLTWENTITEYAKGGGAARFFAGIYGAGQPILRVEGVVKDGDKTVFKFEARRSGTSAGSRMSGGSMKDEDIQSQDIRSMTLDVSDFVAAIAGKYEARK